MADLGAKVAVLDFNNEAANAVADAISGIAVQVNVSDEAAVDKAIETACKQLPDVPRIVVNCAGVGLAARIVGREGKPSFDVFQKTLSVNLFGTYNVMTHAARRMIDTTKLDNGERGVIINTASIAWQDGQLGQSAYAASKGAIASMCLPAAREFAQFGVRVVAIAPGLFHTPMMDGLPEDVTQKIAESVPHPARLGAPHEYALLAQQIVENPYINGTTIRLDGAVRLAPR